LLLLLSGSPFTEPEPSFYNPIPWQPTVIPSAKASQKCRPCRSRYLSRTKCWWPHRPSDVTTWTWSSRNAGQSGGQFLLCGRTEKTCCDIGIVRRLMSLVVARNLFISSTVIQYYQRSWREWKAINGPQNIYRNHNRNGVQRQPVGDVDSVNNRVIYFLFMNVRVRRLIYFHW